VEHVENRLLNALVAKQRPRAAMPGPSLSGPIVEAEVVQAAAGRGFQLSHHEVWFLLAVNNDVNMALPDVGCSQVPVALGAAIDYRLKHCLAARFV
jgi:hypothetical protein